MKWTVCLVAQEVRLKDLFHLIMRVDPFISVRSPVPCAGVMGLTTIGLLAW